jgi:hypothetical protein
MSARSDRYPLCGRGDVNTYAIFAETNRMLIGEDGRVGCIVPSGIATDDTTKFFFADLMESQSLASLYDFENREGLFPEIDSRMKFCLLTMRGSGKERSRSAATDFVFFAFNVENLHEEQRHFTLTATDIALLNPNTRTCPIFRSKRDAELTKAIYHNVPPLASQRGEDNWDATFFKKMLDFGIHAKLIVFSREPPGPNWLQVYEALMIHHFHHRAATYYGVSDQDFQAGKARPPTFAELQDPCFRVEARCWVERTTFADRMDGKPWTYSWFVSMRDVTNTTNERTAIFAIRPDGPSTDTMPSVFLNGHPREIAWLVGSLSSFVFDYVARQKVGGTHMGAYVVEQLPVLPRGCLKSKKISTSESLESWLVSRILELTYTAWDLRGCLETKPL